MSTEGHDDLDEHLIVEAEKIAVAIGRMFPGLCEVVFHDLRQPEHAIRMIENNLSGRRAGDSATELGLRRIADPDYPSVIQNYPNQFPDGRPVKSTSIGIKNAEGRYIAALCLNLDVSTISPMTLTLANLVATEAEHRGEAIETLRDRTARELRNVIEGFAAAQASTPRGLGRTAKRDLVRHFTVTAASHPRVPPRPSPTCSEFLGAPFTTMPSSLNHHRRDPPPTRDNDAQPCRDHRTQ